MTMKSLRAPAWIQAVENVRNLFFEAPLLSARSRSMDTWQGAQLLQEVCPRADEIAPGGQIRTQPVYQCAFFCTINSQVYP